MKPITVLITGLKERGNYFAAEGLISAIRMGRPGTQIIALVENKIEPEHHVKQLFDNLVVCPGLTSTPGFFLKNIKELNVEQPIDFVFCINETCLKLLSVTKKSLHDIGIHAMVPSIPYFLGNLNSKVHEKAIEIDCFNDLSATGQHKDLASFIFPERGFAKELDWIDIPSNLRENFIQLPGNDLQIIRIAGVFDPSRNYFNIIVIQSLEEGVDGKVISGVSIENNFFFNPVKELLDNLNWAGPFEMKLADVERRYQFL